MGEHILQTSWIFSQKVDYGEILVNITRHQKLLHLLTINLLLLIFRAEDEVFFIYDTTVLQKEEDEIKDAILYFYPTTVSYFHLFEANLKTYEAMCTNWCVQ